MTGILLQDPKISSDSATDSEPLNTAVWTTSDPANSVYKKSGANAYIAVNTVSVGAKSVNSVTTVSGFSLVDGLVLDFDFVWRPVTAAYIRFQQGGTHSFGLYMDNGSALYPYTEVYVSSSLIFGQYRQTPFALTSGSWYSCRINVKTGSVEYLLKAQSDPDSAYRSHMTLVRDFSFYTASQVTLYGSGREFDADNIVVHTPHRILYTVSDADTSLPLSGAALEMFDQGGNAFAAGDLTEADGKVSDPEYLLLDARKTPATLLAYKSGYGEAAVTDLATSTTGSIALSPSGQPVIGGVTYAPATVSQGGTFVVSCTFSNAPDIAFCAIGADSKKMTLNGTTGSAEFRGRDVGVGTFSATISAVKGSEGDKEP